MRFIFGFGVILAVFMELDVHVADEFIGLYAFFYGVDTVSKELICKHRFTDVYAAIVDDVGFEYIRSAELENAG